MPFVGILRHSFTTVPNQILNKLSDLMRKKYPICVNILPIRFISSTVVPIYKENELYDIQFHWTAMSNYTVLIYFKENNTCSI